MRKLINVNHNVLNLKSISYNRWNQWNTLQRVNLISKTTTLGWMILFLPSNFWSVYKNTMMMSKYLLNNRFLFSMIWTFSKNLLPFLKRKKDSRKILSLIIDCSWKPDSFTISGNLFLTSISPWPSLSALLFFLSPKKYQILPKS